MDSKFARILLEKDTFGAPRQKQRVFRGLEILSRYDDDIQLSFEHDQIFAGDFEKLVSQMTIEEVEIMRDLGWFEAYESWSHY